MPNVSPVFSINGSAPGAKAAVAASASVIATIDDISGITTVLWEIVATDETNTPADYTLVQSGVKGETVTTTALGAGTAAILQATVNNGVDPSTGNNSTSMVATGKFYVLTSPGGLEVGCVGETYESDRTFGSTGEINSAIRTAGGGSGVVFATSGQLSTINAGDAADAGALGAVPRADHQHPVATAAPVAVAIADVAAEGVSTSLARADHVHALAAPAAPVNVTKAAAATGSSASPARADHKHDVTTAVAGPTRVGDAAAEGTATSLARSDHVHSVAAPAAPANVTKAAASAGASTTFARADHKHDVTTATPSSVGTANSEGSATTLSRADHVHDHGAQTSGTLHATAVPSGAAGFLTGAFAQDLTDATATPTASKIVKYGATAETNGAYFHATGVVPGSSPASGLDIYSDAGAGKASNNNGVIATFCPAASSTSTTTICDWQIADKETTDATPTSLLSITVPDSVVGRITYIVMARVSEGGNWYERTARVRHNGTDAVLVQTLTPVADREDINASCDVTISQSGDNITLSVTGVAATTIGWVVSAHAEFYRP